MYTLVHKTLRRMMYDFAMRLAKVDPFDDPSLRSLSDSMDELYGFLEEHAYHEETYIHPLLERVDVSLCRSLDEGHDDIESECADMRVLMNDLLSASDSERVSRAAILLSRFECALGSHLDHFATEERDGNTILWSHYSAEELIAIHAAIQQNIAPPRFEQWLDKMIPAMSCVELAGLLQGMRETAPAPVVRGFEEKLRVLRGDAVYTKAVQ